MAHKKTSVLEINGRHYDASTGKLLTTTSDSHVASTTQTVSQRAAAQSAKAHKPQRAQTLRRDTVAKPTKTDRHNFRVQVDTTVLAIAPNLAVIPKLSVAQVHPGRLQRSKRVSKNKLISHYAQSSASSTQSATPHQPAIMLQPQTAKATPQSPKQPSHTVFERALAQADSHNQPPFNPKRHVREQRKHNRRMKRLAVPFYRRRSTLAVVSLSVLAITGLVAMQYRPMLTLHFANARAGFTANLPSFRPAGFSYSHFSYSPGLVGIQFSSDNSDRSFSLKQQLSDLNDQTLLQSQVMRASHYYQALQVAGRTIYVYGQNNASWLDHGVLYDLNSNGSLSTTDILNIASSI